MPVIRIEEGNFEMQKDHTPHHSHNEERDHAKGLDNARDGVEHIKIFIFNMDHARGHNKREKIKFYVAITPVMKYVKVVTLDMLVCEFYVLVKRRSQLRSCS